MTLAVSVVAVSCTTAMLLWRWRTDPERTKFAATDDHGNGDITVAHVHQTRLFQKIKRGRFSFHEQYWDPISDGAKDLIARLESF